MTVTSSASTRWRGDLESGAGTTRLPRTGTELGVDWRARSATGETTTPEELLAAAHASCFAMAFSHELTQAGFPPASLDVDVQIGFQPGTGVTGSDVSVRGEVPGIDAETFARIAEAAKAGCPVSAALAGIPITLVVAELIG